MKTKFTLILSVLTLLAILMPADIAQARKSGMLPEDNNTNSVSGKNGGNKKLITEVKIRLVAAAEFKGAKGSARSRVRSDKQDLQVEVQVSKNLAGTVLGVTMGDTVIGSMTVNALGKAHLEISTENGDLVPVIQVGSIIGVVTGEGAIILAGTF